MRKTRTLAALCTLALTVALAAPAAWATNGMEMVGTNPRSTGMGGADVAVDSDASAVSGNPAVICGCSPSSASIGATDLMPTLNMKNVVPGGANDVDGEFQYFVMPQVGYVHSLAGSPITLGFGLYAQGGMGVNFHDVNTGMGTSDQLMSQVSFMRVNPILAYRATNELTLGATVMLGYAQMKFKFFPETANPQFAGMSVRDLSSFGVAGRVGAQYKIGTQWRVGGTYTTKTALKLDDGTATLNFGFAKVDYDAKMADFTWPQEAEFGVAYLPVPGLTLAADVKWINWSDSIKKPVLKIRNPSTTMPVPQTVEVPFTMNWDDQWVYAIGAEYEITPVHSVRIGYNYGKNPVPDANLNPLFPAIVEHHLTLGYGANLGKWSIDLAYEHAFQKTQGNTTADQSLNPFGPGLEVQHSQNTVTASLTYWY